MMTPASAGHRGWRRQARHRVLRRADDFGELLYSSLRDDGGFSAELLDVADEGEDEAVVVDR